MTFRLDQGGWPAGRPVSARSTADSTCRPSCHCGSVSRAPSLAHESHAGILAEQRAVILRDPPDVAQAETLRDAGHGFTTWVGQRQRRPDRMQLASAQVAPRPDAELLEKHRPQRALADTAELAQVRHP